MEVSSLALAIVACARNYLGRQETDVARPNYGPKIEGWLEWVGIRRPAPWCAAFACSMVREASVKVGASTILRGSAGVWRLWDLNQDLAVTDPDVGCLVFWDHGHGLGHVGVVTCVVRVDGVLTGLRVISGNTNAGGSRDADSVVERDFEVPGAHPIIGYVSVD